MNTKRILTYSLYTLIIFATWFIPMPIWSIFWLDLVILLAVFFKYYQTFIITSIFLIFWVEVLWIMELHLSANRLTHFAFLWAIMGVLKFMATRDFNLSKKQVVDVKGDILGEFGYTEDPLLNVVKETVIVLILTVSYVMIDMFIRPEWWG